MYAEDYLIIASDTRLLSSNIHCWFVDPVKLYTRCFQLLLNDFKIANKNHRL